MLPSSNSATALMSLSSTAALWHNRLGHPHIGLLPILSKQYNLSIPAITHLDCYPCNKAKSHKLPFHLSVTHTSEPFELVHMDVWGPSPIPSFSGFRYYLLLVDDYTKYCWLFPLHAKSEVTSCVQAFKVFVSNHFAYSIKTFRSDNGGEFLNKIMASFFAHFGILHETTCPYTPEQNGVAERKHGHIIETAISLLQQAQLPIQFWLEAITTALYLISRLPNSSIKFQVPFHVLYKKAPDYSMLKPFGCCCFPWLRPYASNKLTSRSTPCILLGYCASSKGYRCLDPLTNRVYISRHVKFLEHDFPYPKLVLSSSNSDPPSRCSSLSPVPTFKLVACSSSVDTCSSFSSSIPPLPTSDAPSFPDFPHESSLVSPQVPSSDPIPIQTVPSSLISSGPTSPQNVSTSTPAITSIHPMTTRSKSGVVVPKRPFSLLVHNPPFTEPLNFKEAVVFPEWQRAMAEEYSALVQQGTWTLVPLPPQAPIIGCKWIFKIKRHSDGSVARYKARLVAQGYQQTDGIDYNETFSPVVKQQTIRIVLSLAVTFDWTVKQLDVSNAFLHGTLHEQVYLKQPQGYVSPQFPNHACQLHKALYGLKQAPRAWYDMLSKSLVKQGFQNSLADSSLFVLSHQSDLVYVLVYVDDILITGNNSQLVDHIIKGLGSDFALKDLGVLHYFLGIEVLHTPSGMMLSQAKYAKDLLIKAGMDDCRPCASPSSIKSTTLASDLSFESPEFYRTLVGSLQYLTLTRPELSYAVNSVCQHMHHPLDSHFTAVKRILRYVKGSLDQGLCFSKGNSLHVTAFSDADWAGDALDRRSTGGYCVFLGTNLVSWSSKKQPTVARSSTEAEYKALANAIAEVVWIDHLLKDLKYPVLSSHLPVLWCDNSSAISLASNPVFHARTKHVEVDFHFVREKVLHKQLLVKFVPSELQIADVLTKPLTIQRFHFLRSKLQLFHIPASVCGGVLDRAEVPEVPPQSSPIGPLAPLTTSTSTN